MSQERDYVLGTHDEESARLLLQHRVWRPRALDAWRRAGFTVGQTLVDLGCGPGHAAVDLAEIVGPAGRIVAIDRSRRFLDTLEATCRQRGIDQITPLELDLNTAGPPPGAADGLWARWVFAFVKQPRELLARVGGALKRGGVLVVHEYFDYRVWQWPAGFIRVGLARLVELGHLTSERARAIADALAAREAAPHTLMVTPALLEIIAVRR